MKSKLKAAIKITLPVFFGYTILGIGFGLLLEDAGYNVFWAIFASVVIYAGSAQYVMVDFMKTGLDLLSCAVTTLTVNSRYIFYGISFLDEFAKMGKRKWYMIFGLTDETYSILCSLNGTSEAKDHDFIFLITLLDHIYWVFGSALGAAMGQLLPINTAGVEFSMTALFVVIFLDQWKAYDSHIPVYVSFGCGVLFLVVLGPDLFLLPTLVASVFLLIIFKNKLSAKIVKERDMDDN